MVNLKCKILNYLQLSFELMYYLLSCVQLFASPWTVAHQAPLSMEFSRQEYWNGLSCPPPGDLPNPGIKPTSLTSPVLVEGFFTTSATWDVSPCGRALNAQLI